MANTTHYNMPKPDESTPMSVAITNLADNLDTIDAVLHDVTTGVDTIDDTLVEIDADLNTIGTTLGRLDTTVHEHDVALFQWYKPHDMAFKWYEIHTIHPGENTITLTNTHIPGDIISITETRYGTSWFLPEHLSINGNTLTFTSEMIETLTFKIISFGQGVA